MHHEVELVVVMGQGGRHIPAERALAQVAGYGVGLDMTLRDVQRRAKEQGQPWTVAKGFDTAAPVSRFAASSAVTDPGALELLLRVNGAVRQHASTRDMLMPLDAVIAYLSAVFTLEPGDLVFTGTPAGVGPVVSGDVLHAELVGLARLTVRVV